MRLPELFLYSVNLATRQIDASAGFAEILGWTRGGAPWPLDALIDLVHAEDRSRVEGGIESAVASHGSFEFEFRVRAPRGERWLHVVGSFVPGESPRLVGTGMDTTSRRLAHQALHASEAKVSAVLDAAIDGILTLDAAGRIESVNRTLLGLLRARREALIGAPWQSVFRAAGDQLPPEGVLVELVGRRADGTLFPVECSLSQVNEGPVQMRLLVVRDISDRRRLERQMLDSREQLQRQIGQDLHDGLGQLLTGTAFLAAGLLPNVTPEYRASAERVVELVNAAIARVRSLARGLSPIYVDARSLASVLHNVVAESSELLGATCHLDHRDGVDTDHPATIAQLSLIVREAITNAVRHGKARRIRVTLGRDGDRALLSIEDDGIGIDKHVDASRDGLGLRSMRYRAKVIGGVLEVAPGRAGTIVRCWWSE